MRFQVLVDDEPRPVEIVFGSAPDLAVLSRWRAPAVLASRPGVRDTLEFAQLASKRWRYYRRSIATASSLESFRTIVAREPEAEISFLLLVRADWFKPSRFLGLAQGRRYPLQFSRTGGFTWRAARLGRGHRLFRSLLRAHFECRWRH